MAQSSLRIALPKKPSGSAGRFWPNHRIHVLKAKALLFSSDYGRGFGSVFHHQLFNAKTRDSASCRGFFLGNAQSTRPCYWQSLKAASALRVKRVLLIPVFLALL
ncbi:hypothetical protein JYK21_35265 [Ralstonia pickettii]|nr:hypothetical protein [Ralstonia pickettii]